MLGISHLCFAANSQTLETSKQPQDAIPNTLHAVETGFSMNEHTYDADS